MCLSSRRECGECRAEGGGGGERGEGGVCALRVMSALARPLLPHDWLPGRGTVYGHQGG